MDIKKGKKQSRDERKQDDCPTSAKIHSRCRVVLLGFFISALFLSFFKSIPFEMKLYRNYFSQVSVLFRGFLNHLPNRKWTHWLRWKRTHFAWGTKAFCTSDEGFSAGGERVENAHSNFTHTQLHVATSDFQTELILRWLLLRSTHLRKRAVAITLSDSYSTPSTLHAQIIYAIVLSAGLNGFQVNYMYVEQKGLTNFLLRTVSS